MASAVSTLLVLVLLAGALLKARDRDASAIALSTFGLAGARVRRGAVHALIATELAFASALAAGFFWAAPATAALFLAFAAITAAALLSGRSGRPCACFSGRSRLGAWTPLRALALAATAAALASGRLPVAASHYDRLLTAALCVSLATSAALAAALMALAREVGVLRLDMTTRGALEIAGEGPALGADHEWATAMPVGRRALLRLAIFSSEGCPMCRQVAPAVAHVAADPLVAVQVFDEVADEHVWAQAGVPGSPYAVAFNRDGVALAKGTFNSLSQLESILAGARAREGGGLSLAA